MSHQPNNIAAGTNVADERFGADNEKEPQTKNKP